MSIKFSPKCYKYLHKIVYIKKVIYMTVSKIHRQTILDFSDKKATRNSIIQALRRTEMYDVEPRAQFVIGNVIKVGMYNINLLLEKKENQKSHKLRKYGKFMILISEENQKHYSPLTLTTDCRFNSQLWAKNMLSNNLLECKINTLVDIILHCKRLDNLKTFL